jgi:penicillin-binding protein 1C
VVQAALAAEDKRFFQHRGLDLFATARALLRNVTERRVTSGASTITQQLVKISAPRPRTFLTKVKETAQALRLEQIWTKEQILTAYLNRLDFGNLNVGIATAAHSYFDKPLSDLSAGEAAFLAGLPMNPTRLNPHRAFGQAARRQQTVLRRMHAAASLSAVQLDRALQETVRVQAPGRRFRAPHFAELVLRQAAAEGGSGRTTLDLGLNRFVEQKVRERIDALQGQNVGNAAVVVLDNASGEVLALVGSQDYFAPGSGQVNGACAPRSAGSTLKPFTYLLALEAGATPATVVADVAATFPTATGFYRPENYNQRCYGPVRLRLALGNSLNIPAVRLLASLGGAAPLQERLQAWGITTLRAPAAEYGLGLTLGNAGVSLLELTNAYATLARLGEWRPLQTVRGRSLDREEFMPDPALPATTPLAAWLIADMLSDNGARTLSFGVNSPLRFDFPVACKTGTSSDFRDNWAMGYTPEFTVGVWVGNFDGTPMAGVSGVTGAAPILHDVFEHLRAQFGTSWYPTPPEIVRARVHPITGKRLANDRADGSEEKFATGFLPPIESRADYDASGRVLLDPIYQAWSGSAENGLDSRVAIAGGTTGLRVVSPVAGTTFIADPDLPSSQRVPLRATGSVEPQWGSDTLTVRESGGRWFAEALEGRHRISVRNPETGESVETWIRVKQL